MNTATLVAEFREQLRVKPHGAIFDAQYHFRYALWRTLTGDLFASSARRLALFLGCNPSKAGDDPATDDPTVRLLYGITERAECGRFVLGNVHAFIATDPADMRAAKDPVGPFNDIYITEMIACADVVICMWGQIGDGDRARKVERLITSAGKTPFGLAVTKDGQPRHPLRVPKCTPRPLIELRREVAHG